LSKNPDNVGGWLRRFYPPRHLRKTSAGPMPLFAGKAHQQAFIYRHQGFSGLTNQIVIK